MKNGFICMFIAYQRTFLMCWKECILEKYSELSGVTAVYKIMQLSKVIS